MRERERERERERAFIQEGNRVPVSKATHSRPSNRQARVKGRSRVLFIIYYSRVYLREAKAKGRKRRIDSSVQGLGYSYRCLVPSVAVSSTVTTVIAASGVEMPNRRLHDMPL